jgi:two-component system phosphate regulon sensor histidine kinase PhoR
MATWAHRDAPARLPALFALVGTILLVGLIWVGWRLIEQDRALENQRIRERLESASSLICRELDRGLSDWEQLLGPVASGAPAALPAGAVAAVFEPAGIARQQGARLLYHPFVAAPPEPPADLFAAAERQEFRSQDYEKACAMYRALTRTGNRLTRAGALMRLARCLRRQQRLTEALAVYAELAEFGDTPVAGSPAELLARRERIALYQARGDNEARGRETALLASALDSGRFRIDRATYEFYRDSLPAEARSPESDRTLALAEAVEAVWTQWREAPEGGARMSWPARGVAFVAVLRKTPGRAVVLVANLDDLMLRLDPTLRQLRVRLEIIDPRGRSIWGDALANSALHIMKTTAETGLPWSVRVASADDAAERTLAASRRKLLISVLALIVLALAAAGYAIFRAVTKELSVARLQSDFVAAVSHEFRTPLAAMCHLTESLEEGRVDEDRRPVYYRTLARENRRLTKMVEDLLDFARMESGRQVYRKEELEVGDLVRGVVDAVSEEALTSGRRIHLELPAGERRVRGDGEALARAVRNLLDNAVKYSPAASPVRVEVSAEGQQVAVSVRDEGDGITKTEQRRIFGKFVRGSSSRDLNVKGTGIGLAMVRHIVEAHGGSVVVDSEPGRGSRFTILLPGNRT